MIDRVRGAACGVLVALVIHGCAKPAPQADSTAAVRPPDTVRPASAPDTTKTRTTGKTGDTRLRDSVLKPGVGGHQVIAVPSVADTAKKRPPR